MEARETIESRLADLHRQRGLALLSGKKFDNGSIVAEHEKLAALEDLENAKANQAREASTEAHQSQVTATRTEIADLTTASGKALAEAEANLRAAVGAMKLHLQHEAGKRKAIGRLNTLTGTKESALSEMELHNQSSLRWASLIKSITNHPSHYGVLEYPGMRLPSPHKSWT